MIVIGATKEQAEGALAHANEYFHGNLQFKTLQEIGHARDGRPKLTLTLTVKNSADIGSRRRPFTGERIAAACWHAHGVFMDALPAGVEIQTGNARMQAGDKWQDFNIGSMAQPCAASRACNCMEWNTGGVLPFPVNV